MRTKLGKIALVPSGEGRTFRVGAHEIAVFQTRAGGVHACQAACPHRGGRLADGLLGDGVVVCPLHARRYDLRSGARLDGEGERLAVHRACVEGDELVVDLLLGPERLSPDP